MLPPSPACATVCFCVYSDFAFLIVSAHSCSSCDAAPKRKGHYPSFMVLQPLPPFLYRHWAHKENIHTLTSISVHWKLSLLHGWNFIFIHLFYNCPDFSWLLRWPTTNVRGSFSMERTFQRWRSYHPSQLFLFYQARHEAIIIGLNT